MTRFAHRNEELIKICLARGFVAQLIKAPNYSSGCSSKPDIFSGWFFFLTKTRESEVEETWTLATAKISFSLVIMGSTNKLTQFPCQRGVKFEIVFQKYHCVWVKFSYVIFSWLNNCFINLSGWFQIIYLNLLLPFVHAFDLNELYLFYL